MTLSLCLSGMDIFKHYYTSAANMQYILDDIYWICGTKAIFDKFLTLKAGEFTSFTNFCFVPYLQ